MCPYWKQISKLGVDMVIKSFFSMYRKLYWDVDEFEFNGCRHKIDDIDFAGKLCDAADVLDGVRDGKTYSQIAKTCHISEAGVYRRLKKVYDCCRSTIHIGQVNKKG